MRSGGGKAKGSAFEREICKRLSLWVSGGKELDLFWRSAMSGGRATVAARKGVILRRQAGDITAVAPEGHALTDKFYVECKHVRSLDLESFIVKRRGKIQAYWNVAVREARRHHKEPLLIARQNRLPTIALLKTDYQSGICLAQRKGAWAMVLLDDLLRVPYPPW